MAESTDSDPRYHAAFQRGYQKPASRDEPVPGGEPARRDEVLLRRQPGASARTVPVPVEPSTAEAGLDTAAAAGFDEKSRGVGASPGEPHDSPLDAAARPSRPALLLDRRLPMTLAVVGVVLVLVSLLALWWGTTLWYSSAIRIEGLTPDQYLRILLTFVIPAGLTVGLLSLCAAIVVQAVRSSRS